MNSRALAAAVAVVLRTGCGTSHTGVVVHHATASSAAAPTLTCSNRSGIITTLVADQHAQDKALQEGWVMDNDGPDAECDQRHCSCGRESGSQ